MALLEKAKKAAEEKPKHKKKHPAAKPSVPSQPEGDEGEESNGAGDQDQPDTSADDSESEGAPEGGGAAAGSPAQSQQGGGEDDESGADAGGDQGDTQQPAQGVGGQGASPVPNPAAPGAGDTSGGEDTPDQDADQDPNAQPPETPGENTAAGPGSNTDIQQIPLSPGLKDEYDQANDLLMQLLYKSPDNKLASGLLQGLMPQGPGKIKNASMLSIDVLIQLHKRLQLPPQLILPVAKDVVAHVLNLGEQVKQIQYSDQESTAILGCVVEGVLRIFGVKKSQLQVAGHLFGKDALMKQQAKYQQFHAHAKAAIDANNQDWHHPELGGQQQQAGGPPGPQTGAPVGAQPPAPQSGAPPQPQVPPATPDQQGAAGGMLSQAVGAQ